MGVIDGQPVDAAVTNPSFINKNVDDVMPNKLGFSRIGSGLSIADIQQAVNNIYTASGVSETQTGTQYNATPSTINNGDPYQLALQKLAGKFAPATGHMHTGAQGDAPPISAGSLGAVPLMGYVEQTGNLTATGSSINVTTAFSSKTPSTSPAVSGVPVTSPYNMVVLSASGSLVVDATTGHNTVYGRLTSASGSWTLSFYANVLGVETAYTFPSSTVITAFYQELFNPLSSSNPTYSQVIQTRNLNRPPVSGGAGSGSVTSVALGADPIFSVTGSPITTAGTLGLALQSQPANTVLAAPSGSSGNPLFRRLNPPTVQIFAATGMNAASGTYITPTSPVPTYIRTRMVGAGGGGSGSADNAHADGGAGGNGGNTSFGPMSCTGGFGGGSGASFIDGGAGGAASLGSGPVGIAFEGGDGGSGSLTEGTNNYCVGGMGSSSPFGGQGKGGMPQTAGQLATDNTGSGGGGGGSPNGGYSGAGGGAGGYIDAIIVSPATGYAFFAGGAGSAGNAGTNGFFGGQGSGGFIIVEEYYQ